MPAGSSQIHGGGGGRGLVQRSISINSSSGAGQNETTTANEHGHGHGYSIDDEEPDIISPELPLVDVDVVVSPGDRYFLVYLAFYFLGLTTLLPWNFFINADKYWMYKFRSLNSTNVTTSHPHGKSDFQASFASYLAIASNVPATVCFVANMFVARWISAKARMISSLLLTLLCFMSQTALVRVDTDAWQLTFFRVTIVTCVLMNSFCSFFQCGLFGVIGKFPHSYTTATMGGQALGGIFASIANIFSIIVSADETRSAFMYFTLGSLSLFTAMLIVLFILPKLLFYKFHAGGKQVYRWVDDDEDDEQSEPMIQKRVRLVSVFKKVWVEAATALLTFLVTLTALPALLVLVVSEHAPSVWNEKYFVPVSFLIFNIGDYMGRVIAGVARWPSPASTNSFLLALARFALLPLLLLCNLHPRRNLPIWFHSDIEFSLINFSLAFSNGYLTNVVYINAPQLVGSDEQEEANSIVTMGLGLGLSAGVLGGLIAVGQI